MDVLLNKLLEARRRKPFGQFGSADDECTDNGALGCTHTAWRFIIFVYTGKLLSHDEISKHALYPCGGGSVNRGMRIEEGQRLCREFNLPYLYKAGLSSAELLRASRVGPVLFGMRYGNWPNWKGYKGRNVPRPWARPHGRTGRNQFTGFFGSHAGVLLGYTRVIRSGKFVRNDCYVMEPNHNSAARPEKVPFDIVTQTQLARAYAAIKQTGWADTMAFIPTKSPTFPGGLG